MKKPVLIIVGGLPGIGKTLVSKVLATWFDAVYIRVDSIEQSIKNSTLAIADVGDADYIVGQLVAKDNLAIGNSVVADSVNPISISRLAWRDCAAATECHIVEIELICSDELEHKQRVEQREPDISGHKVPTWKSVVDREYEHWEHPHVILDTAAKSPKDVSQLAVDAIEKIVLN